MAKVLVVDDEKSIRIVIREFLKMDGHEVFLAENVEEAFGILEEQVMDVVVTDIIMPRITGVEMLRTIDERWPDIQVVMITGEPNVDTAAEAVRSGAYDYLSKPISKDEMRKVVGNAARIKALGDEKKRLEVENRKYREHLETLVEERTAELSRANDRLWDEINERKRAEELISIRLKEKEVLLREVHHRVKNNMQIIQSLFRLQTGAVGEKSAEDVFMEAGNRIRSISLIHEKLYRAENLSKIDCADYIESMARGLYQSYRLNPSKIRLNMKCNGVKFGINQAIPCGLILNELLTNSIKHAFPDKEDGEIDIILRTTDKEGSEYEIIYRDNGIGIPEDVDFKGSGSLGLHIVKILAEDQLRGEISVERDGGTTFRIKFTGVK